MALADGYQYIYKKVLLKTEKEDGLIEIYFQVKNEKGEIITWILTQNFIIYH